MLETRGYRVVIAKNGEDALEVFRDSAVDLVLSDLIMPQMDGNELIRRMKELAPDIPMILISGTVKSGERANCVNNRTVSDKMVAGIHEASIPLGCHPEIAPSFFCLWRSGVSSPTGSGPLVATA